MHSSRRKYIQVRTGEKFPEQRLRQRVSGTICCCIVTITATL
jgi:hypothetical protein